MTPNHQGSLRLFRYAGINVYVHWSWFLVAAYQFNQRAHFYSSPLGSALEYLALFVIVLMHEFGHALACRQVGGRADQIVLWPLGGVAYVSPPPRPGATLWSIAAGPLVNVALVPFFAMLCILAQAWAWPSTAPQTYRFVTAVSNINLVLLVFNLLPIYPLDGGQILRSLLWFVCGRARSLTIAAGIGLLSGTGLLVAALWAQSLWFVILCAFIFMNCWQGLREARTLSRIARAPRHEGAACPACGSVPPQLPIWVCGQCGKPFDVFASLGLCPHCGARFGALPCLECGETRPPGDWMVTRPGPPPLSG